LLETVRFFSTIPVVPFDLACEQPFQALRAMRLRVGSRDLRIAATALVHSVVLITWNRRDFEQVPGRRLDDWSL
jgi:tRNA(fMet)-specific endonuclease VapC